MVGSGGGERSKEAVGMMALHEALRSVCLTTDWTYSVFWTIRPRPRVRGGNGCKVGDDNGSLMLMWEDGFCRGRSVEFLGEMDGGDDPIRKSFSKMSIQLYNYGEGLMGKVASDKCHKWVFKEPTECEPNISNYWQSSYDALPQEWNEQFDSGIQTIAVIQAGHGLLQLGSCKIIAEDLHFVLRMRHTFESLGYQSGFYLTQLFSSTRPASSSATAPLKQPTPPLHLLNWAPRPMPPTGPPMLFHTPAQMFLLPHSADAHMMEAHMMADQENDIKWPNGLSFFGALTGRADEPKLMFDPDPPPGLHKNICSDSNNNDDGGGNTKEFSRSDNSHLRNVEGKFKRSFTLPVRMSTLSPANAAGPHAPDPVDYRTEGGMYPDAMETFLE